MLHLIYIMAFTIVSFFAITNLIRSLITVSYDSQRRYSTPKPSQVEMRDIHPELLDSNGQPVKEPLLVMRSVSIEDARQQLDAIYKASPGNSQGIDD